MAAQDDFSFSKPVIREGACFHVGLKVGRLFFGCWVICGFVASLVLVFFRVRPNAGRYPSKEVGVKLLLYIFLSSRRTQAMLTRMGVGRAKHVHRVFLRLQERVKLKEGWHEGERCRSWH